MKLSEAFEAYENQKIIARNLSIKTLEGYKNTCSSFCSYFGNIKINKINPDVIRHYYCDKLADHASDTIRGQIIQLRAVIKFCHEKGEKTCDPTYITIPKREKKSPKWLDRQDVEKFIDIVATPKRGYSKMNRTRNVLLCSLLFCTGARISEVVALDRDSIKNREFVAIGKSKDPRVCYISPEVEQMLAEYLELRTDNESALFINNQGNRMTPQSAREVFRRVCKQSEFSGIHPHTFRHSFATYALSEGVGIREVGEMLGHQNLDTTKIYTHLTNPQLKLIHAKLMA